MEDLKTFVSAIAQIAEEKGISQEKVIETIEMAIAAAYKKEYGKKGQNIRAKLNSKTGEAKFWQIKLVVDESMLKPEVEEEQEGEVEQPRQEEKEGIDEEEEKKIRFNPERHIMLEDARKIKKSIKVGEDLELPLKTQEDFGRIAAQTAKQVIIQRIREAERDAVLEEFKSKEGEIISGIVQRIEGKIVYFDIGRTTGVLLPQEQIPGEYYRSSQRFRLFVLKVEMGVKEPMILLSRAYPKFLTKLFELEVPEITSGSVIIKSIAREAGSRSKIAVTSTNEQVDPIGSCVGQKGTRVATIINELGGEKLDIIEWEKDPAEYIANALSPAKVLEVKIQEKKNLAVAIVPVDQVSLAIGREGQNVRLAAKLTGWKIDVRSAEKPEESVISEEIKLENEKEEKKAEKKKEQEQEKTKEVKKEKSETKKKK